MINKIKINDKVKVNNKIGRITYIDNIHNIHIKCFDGYIFMACIDPHCELFNNNIEIIDETIYEKFKAKYISKSINLDKSLICKECNWPVIDIEIKDEFRHYKDNELYNSFIYCTNKQCVNHEGQGYCCLDLPEWVKLI